MSNYIIKKYLVLVLVFAGAAMLFAQSVNSTARQNAENPSMTITQEDIVALRGDEEGVNRTGEGVHLFIRKKSGVQSVMLVETTKDPEGKEDNYSYRATSWNQWNGDEIRYLNGQPLVSQSARYSLISSTVEQNSILGECFHIYVPPVVEFGYPWTRNGSVDLGDGTFVNIRTFEKKYGDYTGKYHDNPFYFDFKKVYVEKSRDVAPIAPGSVNGDGYNEAALAKFNEIALSCSGSLTYATGADSLPTNLVEILDDVEDKSLPLDVVFCIDATGSMHDDFDSLIKEWIPALVEQNKDFSDIRYGLVLYRDYNDDYLYKQLPVRMYDFTDNVDILQAHLKAVTFTGLEGGDIPEAVYEGLYAALNYCKWRTNAYKKIILIGDSEPHSKPRGTSKKITQQMVVTQSVKDGVVIDCIILPDQSGLSANETVSVSGTGSSPAEVPEK